MKPKWKVRAIYEAPRVEKGKWTPAHLDIVHDRQTIEGEVGNGFVRWINQEALPAVEKWATDNRIPENSREVFELSTGDYYIRATPNGSYGYMYLEARKEGEGEE